MLIVSTNRLDGSGKFVSFGTTRGWTYWFGSSGGGSVNIFYKEKKKDYTGILDAYGTWTAETGNTNYKIVNSSTGTGYNGGAGACTIGSISTGYFVQD